MKELEAQVRLRSIGRTIAEICLDLGISRASCHGAFWHELYLAMTNFGGDFHQFHEVQTHRREAFQKERDKPKDAVREMLGFILGEPPPHPGGVTDAIAPPTGSPRNKQADRPLGRGRGGASARAEVLPPRRRCQTRPKPVPHPRSRRETIPPPPGSPGWSPSSGGPRAPRGGRVNHLDCRLWPSYPPAMIALHAAGSPRGFGGVAGVTGLSGWSN